MYFKQELFRLYSITFVLGIVLVACSNRGVELSEERLTTIATTNIIGDVLKQVADDYVYVDMLLPPGSDPHTFSPTPLDIAKISSADILFANGAGLESFLGDYLEIARDGVLIVELSASVSLLPVTYGDEHDQEHDEFDPHTWMDPNNVIVWVNTIAGTLAELDPDHADIFQRNAAKYISEIKELDQWIFIQVAQIPVDQRKLLADHQVFSYFAQRYGFTQIGSIIPGTSTLSEPSALVIAQVQDLIRRENIQAIFLDHSSNSTLPKRIAEDAGINIVYLYLGSLTETNGQASTYLDYMYYNVTAIVNALK